ncbi:MAG: ABC-type branched-chain amino acid transport system, ATPase component [Frankiales bacterium]|nr:ABC-type branched-chain amino acid transport system, ATPase component [Frankiales bacterium]
MTELQEGPRLLVPSARELAIEPDQRGDAIPTGVASPEATHERRTVGQFLRDVDPRTIEGPGFVLLVLCLVSLFARIDEQAIAVLLPQIRTDFGVDLAFIGTVSSLAGILFTVIALPLGYLADRIRRVLMVRTGTLLTAGTIAITGLVGGPAAFAGARVANGLAQGIAPPASFPLTTDYFPARSRARVFALYFAAAQLGIIAGPAIAGITGDRIGWRATLLVLGGLAFGAGLLTLLLREPVRGQQDRPDPDAPVPPAPSFSEAYRAAASISTLRRFWYATPFVGARGIFALAVLPIFLTDVYQLSSTQLGLVLTLNGASGLVGLLIAGPFGAYLLRDRPGRFMTVLGFAPIVQAAAVAALSTRPPLPAALAVLQVFVVAEVIGQPGGYTLISLVVPSRIRGLGLATNVPWQLINLVALPFVLRGMLKVGLPHGLLLLVPLLVTGGLILVTGAPGVERDIRAAQAADAADERARASASTLLVCRGVEVAYGGVQVLYGVDLDVGRGEIVALVGTNGAGKSTLLRAIAGVTEASGGAIFLDGRDITHLPPHTIASLGVVSMPGGAAVFPGLTVAENIRSAAWTHRDDEAGVAARTAEVLGLFPILRERWDAQAGTLSGGEQQMVGLAQALLMSPQLLLVDELSLGLAPAVVEQLLGVLRRLNEAGTTVVLVEQSLNVALTVADRAVFMEKGEIRFDGPTEELLARPDLVRSVFMGGAAGGTRMAGKRPAVTAGAPALVVDDLAVSFGGVAALTGVDLEVLPGEVLGIIGPNGAGKTTLFDCISGFVAPDRGRVVLAGNDVTAGSPDARARLGLGRSFQNARLFPALTVRENLAAALERKAVRNPLLAAVWAPQVRSSERRIARQVDRLVDLLGLGMYADSTLAELSTGSRRAVDVACIIALEPSVLLLDEPSSGLAQAETEALGPLLSRIVRETGCGMVVIEHDIPLVTALSDRMLAMEAGAVIVSGTPTQVRSDPRVLASYLAASDDVVQRSGRMSALTALLTDERTTDAPT